MRSVSKNPIALTYYAYIKLENRIFVFNWYIKNCVVTSDRRESIEKRKSIDEHVNSS